MIRMKVQGLAIDPYTNVPIVILKDSDEKNALPVWIGVLEASAIASQLEKIEFSRPMTHDLLSELLRNVKVGVDRVELNDLRDNVYYATIHLSNTDGVFKLDARPSDAIALALRTGSPIFVDTSVLEKSRTMESKTEPSGDGEKSQAQTDGLEGLSPDSFGKYKM